MRRSFARSTSPSRSVESRLSRMPRSISAKGEVLGLLGDNGAGKSTLLKILTGFHRPSGGKIYFQGAEIELKSVSHARSLGIEPVYQDLALISELNVYRNMFLQREIMSNRFLGILDDRTMRERAIEQLDEMGVNIPNVDVEISKLSGGQRQAIAVARSVFANAKVLLLDEPTAAMGVKESAMILDLIRRLKEKGDVSVILVAHNYAHVFDVCDRVSLLQNGAITFDKPTRDTSVEELMHLVTARDPHGTRDGCWSVIGSTPPPKGSGDDAG